MPKYCGSLPEVGQKQKTERKKEDRKLVITMASYDLQTQPRVAHAKPPGPINLVIPQLYQYNQLC